MRKTSPLAPTRPTSAPNGKPSTRLDLYAGGPGLVNPFASDAQLSVSQDSRSNPRAAESTFDAAVSTTPVSRYLDLGAVPQRVDRNGSWRQFLAHRQGADLRPEQGHFAAIRGPQLHCAFRQFASDRLAVGKTHQTQRAVETIGVTRHEPCEEPIQRARL